VIETLRRGWWLILLRGILAVIFGIMALVWPGITVLALVLLWGVYAVVDGASEIGLAVRGGEGLTGGGRWALALLGLFGVAAGVIAFLWPGITALVLAYLIGFWAILTGVMEIVAAVRLREEIDNEWLMGISGALSVVLGAILVIAPGAGVLGLVTVIAIFAIAWGITLILLSFRVRNLGAAPAAA
jgi:uncharacterized membrane protein HdeD (DUF308 family)